MHVCVSMDKVDRCMDGWMEGWIYGWMDGPMYVHTCRTYIYYTKYYTHMYALYCYIMYSTHMYVLT